MCVFCVFGASEHSNCFCGYSTACGYVLGVGIGVRASELQQSQIPTVQACGNGVPGSGSGTEPEPEPGAGPELRSACSAGCSRSDIAPSG